MVAGLQCTEDALILPFRYELTSQVAAGTVGRQNGAVGPVRRVTAPNWNAASNSRHDPLKFVTACPEN